MNMHITTKASNFSLKTKIHAEAHKQQGVTLLELMVGIVIGLLVVAVAMGALMVSRNVSGTISDASDIQQQAAYAIRTIGQQLRQAGSLYLNLDPNRPSGSPPAEDKTLAASTPVAFETTASAEASGNDFDPATSTLNGTASPVTLTIGYRRYKDSVYGRATGQTLSLNCLGGPSDDPASPRKDDQRVESIFWFDAAKNTLKCEGNATPPPTHPITTPPTTAQPILQNVADFQVRYLQQDNTSAGDTKIQYVTADDVESNKSWSKVQAVEICMVLYGDEVIDIPAGSQYTDCSGQKVNFPTSGAAARRMHLTFRNVFQLRSQGLIGSVL